MWSFLQLFNECISHACAYGWAHGYFHCPCSYCDFLLGVQWYFLNETKGSLTLVSFSTVWSTWTWVKSAWRTFLAWSRRFKWRLLYKSHFYMVFGHGVLAVCDLNHPTKIKIHPLLIFQSPLNQVGLTRFAVLMFMQCDVILRRTGPRGLIDSTALL